MKITSGDLIMPKVKVNDINIYYEIHGKGFPFFLIRGLSSDVYRWPPDFISELSKNYKIILFDNRGAGRTDKPDIEYSMEMMAADTTGLMKVLFQIPIQILFILQLRPKSHPMGAVRGI